MKFYGIYKIIVIMASFFSPFSFAIETPSFFHPITQAKETPAGVFFRGEDYLSLKVIAALLDGTLNFGNPDQALGLQDLRISTKDQVWSFPNGGIQITEISPNKEKQTISLKKPLLVLKGEHYISKDDASDIWNFQAKRKDNSILLHLKGKKETYALTEADSPYLTHKVTDFEATKGAVKVTSTLKARSSLLPGSKELELPEGTTLILRRKCIVNGEKSVITSSTDKHLVSYLVSEKDLKERTSPTNVEDTAYSYNKSSLFDASNNEEAIQAGNREKLGNVACLTIDFCWSLRKYEEPLINGLLERSTQTKAPICPVFFISGRWMEQHPEEMHNLIAMSLNSNIVPVWGGHSWAHPKSGGFMNDFSPEQLREDTLKMEKSLLEWGIIPSVFYRFPGLIHDKKRLHTILNLDLFPIDCDSWLAQIIFQENTPFSNPIEKGSIILVHGNGNEPVGIPPLSEWMNKHKEWVFSDITNFFPEQPQIDKK